MEAHGLLSFSSSPLASLLFPLFPSPTLYYVGLAPAQNGIVYQTIPPADRSKV